MQLVSKAKIGRLSAKGIDYPQLRLPSKYSQIVGTTADIFATEHEGKQAFLVVPEHSMSKGDTVLKQSEEVLKPLAANAAEARLSALESEISKLNSLLFSNESDSLHENRKQKAEGEIRTRVVASTGP
jgi:hypothetical protein